MSLVVASGWHHRGMTMVDSSERVLVNTRWRSLSLLSGLALVAVVVAFLVALIDRATVTTHSGLGRVMFGYPLGWLTQDQTTLDPSFPVRLSPASPWENPTSVVVVPLLIDVLGVFALLLVGWLVGRSLLRRIRAAAR